MLKLNRRRVSSESPPSLKELMLYWPNLFQGFEQHIEFVSDGILRDARMHFDGNQKTEHIVRESVASRFANTPKEGFQEAIRHHSYGVMRRKAHQVLKSLTLHKEKEAFLVDLGCGFGWHWLDLAKTFPSVKFLLVDFSMAGLSVCRSLMPFKEYPNVLCLHADVSDIPIQHRLSDFCWSVQVFQHLPPAKRKVAFREILRIQKPGARFYIAWLRAVPILKFIYSVFGKNYHNFKGYHENGIYFQHFDNEIKDELESIFSTCQFKYSETLFHKEIGIILRNSSVEVIDLILARSFLAPLFARQIEIWGRC